MADREVFVDTSGLHALVDKRDAAKLVVTDYVVDETVTLARVRSGDTVALRVLDLIEQSVGVRMERIDTARFDATKAYLRKHVDHAYSFTDCSSFVVMRELRIRKALTTDGHFAEAGVRAVVARFTTPALLTPHRRATHVPATATSLAAPGSAGRATGRSR
jgi:predicted nucleic acid-binding protein